MYCTSALRNLWISVVYYVALTLHGNTLHIIRIIIILLNGHIVHVSVMSEINYYY